MSFMWPNQCNLIKYFNGKNEQTETKIVIIGNMLLVCLSWSKKILIWFSLAYSFELVRIQIGKILLLLYLFLLGTLWYLWGWKHIQHPYFREDSWNEPSPPPSEQILEDEVRDYSPLMPSASSPKHKSLSILIALGPTIPHFSTWLVSSPMVGTVLYNWRTLRMDSLTSEGGDATMASCA